MLHMSMYGHVHMSMYSCSWPSARHHATRAIRTPLITNAHVRTVSSLSHHLAAEAWPPRARARAPRRVCARSQPHRHDSHSVCTAGGGPPRVTHKVTFMWRCAPRAVGRTPRTATRGSTATHQKNATLALLLAAHLTVKLPPHACRRRGPARRLNAPHAALPPQTRAPSFSRRGNGGQGRSHRHSPRQSARSRRG